MVSYSEEWKGNFYRQIKEARRVNTPHEKTHKALKGDVLVINLLFLDISPLANMEVLFSPQSGVL